MNAQPVHETTQLELAKSMWIENYFKRLSVAQTGNLPSPHAACSYRWIGTVPLAIHCIPNAGIPYFFLYTISLDTTGNTHACFFDHHWSIRTRTRTFVARFALRLRITEITFCHNVLFCRKWFWTKFYFRYTITWRKLKPIVNWKTKVCTIQNLQL